MIFTPAMYPRGNVAALMAVKIVPFVAIYASCPLSPVTFRMGAPRPTTMYMKTIELNMADSAPAPASVRVLRGNFLPTRLATKPKMTEERMIAMAIDRYRLETCT